MYMNDVCVFMRYESNILVLPAKHQRFVIRATTSNEMITRTTRAMIAIPMMPTMPSPEAMRKRKEQEKKVMSN
jgi:hypothetical protein